MNDELLERVLSEAGDAARLLLVQGSRGSGKSWWMQRAAERATAAGFTLSRLDGRSITADTMQVPAALDGGRCCVVVDDIDHLDSTTRRAIRAAVEAADGVAIVSATTSTAFDGALSVRVQPLTTDALAEILHRRGVGLRAAQRCATAAAGNPGLAMSLADGLSDAQRSDRALVPDLPRLAANVAADLHARLQPLGERVCRALVVAAADEHGELAAIRSALRGLGEIGEPMADGVPEADALAAMFDAAQHEGIVDIVGSRVIFGDPWLRLAAYHLVAPASRRAAHRALAAAYSAPRQGEMRVRHLVAASNGPSDEVAHAMMAVASAAARRRDPGSAARMSTQAAELSVSSEVRTGCLLRAIGWCLDAGEFTAAGRLVEGLDGVEPAEQAAAAEARDLLVGTERSQSPSPDSADRAPNELMRERDLAGWVGRRRSRLSAWAESTGGAHARVLKSVGGEAAPAELWARAVALRHAGFVRDAVELVERTLSSLPTGDSGVRRRWELLEADLSVLTGRVDRVVTGTELSASIEGRAVLARAALVRDTAAVRDAASLFVPNAQPLRDVRTSVLRGLTAQDHHVLAAAAQDAASAALPVDAGEAWLMAAEVAHGEGLAAGENTAVVVEYVRLSSAALHRCAVHCWDVRLQRLAQQKAGPPSSAVPPTDPALEALSAAEWRVAEAVAGGLTNREVAASLFLSVKTVDFHLQQIYRKLALRSRTELAVRVAGHGQNSVGRSASAAQGAGR